jgi:hypothetical protein
MVPLLVIPTRRSFHIHHEHRRTNQKDDSCRVLYDLWIRGFADIGGRLQCWSGKIYSLQRLGKDATWRMTNERCSANGLRSIVSYGVTVTHFRLFFLAYIDRFRHYHSFKTRHRNPLQFELPNPAGKAGGACTSALLQVLYDHGKEAEPMSWVQTLRKMRSALQKMGYDQIPQLTSSRLIDVNKTMYISPPEFGGNKRAM